MAHAYRYKNRRVLYAYYVLGQLAIDFIDDLRFGRTTRQSKKGLHFVILLDLIEVYNNQKACKRSPFSITLHGQYISVENQGLALSSDVYSDDNCPCEDNCLSDAQIDIIEEKIVEITKQYLI